MAVQPIPAGYHSVTPYLIVGPETLQGTSVGIALYVSDCDAVFHRAVAAGAKVERPLQDQFYGDRSGTVVDPFGHKWTVATHVEDVPRRNEAADGGLPGLRDARQNRAISCRLSLSSARWNAVAAEIKWQTQPNNPAEKIHSPGVTISQKSPRNTSPL